jgi:hypothetical protein
VDQVFKRVRTVGGSFFITHMLTEVQKETELDLPRIVAFDRGKPHCWTMMGDMLERIGVFAGEYCPDTVPEFLVQSVMQDFTSPKPGFLILGAVNEDYGLIGHILACVSVPAWSQKRRCMVLQYKLDEQLPIEYLRAAFEMIVDWGKEQYCSEIIAETKTEAAKRAFTMFYGFTVDLIQVKRAL